MKNLLLQSRSKKNIEHVAEIAASDNQSFKELVDLMEDDKDVFLASLAAWAMSNAFEKNKKLIDPHLSKLIKLACNTEHDGIKRNIVRVWSLMDVPEKYLWEIADICYKYLISPKEAIAVKAFSISVLQHLVNKIPELKEEVQFEIEKQLPHSGPAFRVRARAFFKEINKNSVGL